jgi:hypothetical protein
MELIVGAGFTMVTDAVADHVGPVRLAACTVTTFGTGGTAGAAYNPVLSIVPTVALPPATPFTDHVAWFVLPVTLAVNCCACPTIIVSAGGFTATTTCTASVSALEFPPPGAGVVTATPRLPAFANCAAGSTAVNCVALPYVVANAVPPNSTTDCAQNPDPVTVSVVFPLPALSVAGEMELTTGAGFTMLTEAAADCAGCARLAAVTVTMLGAGGTAGAVYSPVLSTVPTVTYPPATPFTDHVAPWFVLPVTLSVNCCTCPTITVGVGGFTATTTNTASVSALEVPPPGAGVATATPRLPAFANCAAGTTAVNTVGFTNSVASAVPPNSTTDWELKPVPVTVNVVFPLPALTVAGEMELTTGAGFTMVTDAVADCVGSATLAAVTVTVFDEGTIPGAV